MTNMDYAGCCGYASCAVENTREFQGTAFDDGMDSPSLIAGRCGYAPCAAENTREFQGTDCDDDLVTLSSKAGESRESGLLEVIKSDFSSPFAHSKSLSNSSHVSSHVGCTSLGLPSASACALAACTHGFCSASAAVVPLCMHVGDTCACVNSWSDTGRVEGPTGRRSSKGGVSGPAEDLHPVPEVEAGVNFRPAGRGYGGRLQVHFPGGNQALVPGQIREVWSHLPSTRRFLILCLCRLDQARESGN